MRRTSSWCREGKEPLYAIYPEDGLAIADSPLGYVDNGDKAKETLFLQLQQYLLSPPVQAQIEAQGRRVGLVGVGVEHPDPAVFNPDWGIDTRRVLNPIRFPDAAVVRDALNLYQTTFRKPSLTVYCVDFSGSMNDNGGEQGVKSAMEILLDPQKAKAQFLQPSPGDVTMIIPFNSQPLDQWTARGNDPKQLAGLLAQVEALQAGGGTDIYTPVMQGLDFLKAAAEPQKLFPRRDSDDGRAIQHRREPRRLAGAYRADGPEQCPRLRHRLRGRRQGPARPDHAGDLRGGLRRLARSGPSLPRREGLQQLGHVCDSESMRLARASPLGKMYRRR